jgi:ATPase subunit of ABC transporter with duplicated ATPase domains
LAANLEDLREVANRLSARTPDPGTYTTMLQQDVERRTTQLLEALERERKRREQERQDRQQQQQQQQSQQSRNRFNQQRQQLVSLIAELEMLKQLGNDTRRATDDLRTLIEVRADELISESEVALIERLAHRHAEITKLFLQIKAGVEQAMQQGQSGGDEEGQGGRGR